MIKNQEVLNQTLAAWLPLAAVILILSALNYAAVQQNYRQSANDPQIQIAQDIVNAIEQGAPVENIAQSLGSIDIKKSLSPFVMLYDDKRKLVASSAQIDGQAPNYPAGVFDSVKKRGQENLTWQPAAGVRMATVVANSRGRLPG